MADYCSQCHGIQSPGLHTAEEWDATATRMFLRMEHMANRRRGGHRGRCGGRRGRGPGPGMLEIQAPNDAERAALLDYLQTAALVRVDAGDIPSGDTGDTSAALFAGACSRCHALPSPAQHPASEWPAVVKRMRGNMRRMGTQEISDRQERGIVSYLRSVSPGSQAGGP